MKILFKILIIFIIPLAFLTAQNTDNIFRSTESKISETIDLSAATELWSEFVAARESGDEILFESLIGQFREQFPELYPAFMTNTNQSAVTMSESNHIPAGSQTIAEHTYTRSAMLNIHFATDNKQFQVIPPEYAATPGNATFTGPLANTARTYQLLIHDSLLTSIIGKKLTGISWRLPTSATVNWPSTGAVFTSYDIYLSGSVHPSQRSLTFAQNIVGTQTKVREDTLIIPIDAYKFGESPNPWGPDITFRPWEYNGGHLLIEIRHTGSTSTSRSVDAIGTSVIGYSSSFSGAWQSGYTATTGTQGNFSAIKLTFDTGVGVELTGETPGDYELSQNYPNPFNPKTTIDFALPHHTLVTIKVYDMLGREVETLISEELPPGRYSTHWNAGSIPSGVYNYQIQAGDFTQTKKLILLR